MVPARMHGVSVAEIAAGQEVTVLGRLDVNSVAEVRWALREILDRGAGDLLVHLAEAEVHDASGLGMIVGAHHRARVLGRRLVLVDVSPRLDRLLRASRLHRVLAREPLGGTITVFPPAGVGPPLAERVPLPSETVLPLKETVLPLTETVLPPTESVLPLTE